MEELQWLALPPYTEPGVQGKHSCEGFWATAQIINLHGCHACPSARRTCLPPRKKAAIIGSRSQWLCTNREQREIKMDDRRTATHLLWRYCRFGLIRPSIRIYFSIWTSRLFEALHCLRACETPWDRVQPCVGKKMSYFRPCLPRNRRRNWNVTCGGRKYRTTLTFSYKSEIQILNH